MSQASNEPDGHSSPKRGSISTTRRAAIWQAHKQRCAYTGQPVILAELEIDHIIPVATSPAELQRLEKEGVIPPSFDLNGLGNLIPTSKFQNNRKRADLRNNSALFHFLAVAEQFREAAEKYERASVDDSKALSAYLKIKAQAERNDVTVDDIIDLNRQQAEGFTRVRHTPEVADAGDLTLLNATLAQDLMSKPFELGDGSITTVVLHADDEQKVICHNCSEFLKAKDEGCWPYSQFDMNCYGLADRTCEILRMLVQARYAPASMIRYPRITCKDLTKWSSEWVRRVWIEFDPETDAALFERCPTIADLVKAGMCTVLEATEWSFSVDTAKGLALSVSELFRADLNDDGVEEILVFDLAYATGGTLRAGTVIIAEARNDGLIYPADKEGGFKADE